ncbi:aromatic prenyltransferase [Streptomyces sp. L7]
MPGRRAASLEPCGRPRSVRAHGRAAASRPASAATAEAAGRRPARSPNELVSGQERRYNAPLLTTGTRLVPPAAVEAVPVRDYPSGPHLARRPGRRGRHMTATDGTTVDAIEPSPNPVSPPASRSLSGFTEGLVRAPSPQRAGRPREVGMPRKLPFLGCMGSSAARTRRRTATGSTRSPCSPSPAIRTPATPGRRWPRVPVARRPYIRSHHFPGHRLGGESGLLRPQAPRRGQFPTIGGRLSTFFETAPSCDIEDMKTRSPGPPVPAAGRYIKAERSYCGDLVSCIKGWNTFFSRSNTTDPALPEAGRRPIDKLAGTRRVRAYLLGHLPTGAGPSRAPGPFVRSDPQRMPCGPPGSAPECRVLDVGCGAGDVTFAAAGDRRAREVRSRGSTRLRPHWNWHVSGPRAGVPKPAGWGRAAHLVPGGDPARCHP